MLARSALGEADDHAAGIRRRAQRCVDRGAGVNIGEAKGDRGRALIWQTIFFENFDLGNPSRLRPEYREEIA